MFLLKNKYFYGLLIITIGLLLGFSIWGYFALMSHGGYQSLEIKYIAECFIFTALLLIAGVSSLFIYIYNKSLKVYKELDKIYELFDKGNFYTENSFKKLGILGTKILRINGYLTNMNELKTKKISSDSKIINFLLNHMHEELLVLKNNGNISKVSKNFLEINNRQKENILDVPLDKLIEKFEFLNIIDELAKGQHVALKKRLVPLKDKEKGPVKYMVFFPIFNISNELNNAICLFVSEGRFNKFTKMKDNPENNDDTIYKSSSFMRNIYGLFNKDKEDTK